MSQLKCSQACGVTFESELQLPEIPHPKGRNKPSVSIHFGQVPLSLEGATGRGAAYDAAPGQLLLKTPIGRYLIRHGREIVIDPTPTATESEVRVFLLGSAWGALLHQRGILPLHASTVQVGDHCVAFAGVSGAGKSSLAAHLHERGYPLVGDDICPVRFLPGCGAVAFRGFPRLKLWADSMKALGRDATAYSQPRTELEKYELPTDRYTTEPFEPLRRLYLLCKTRDRSPAGIQPVDGPDRLQALLAHTYRFRYLEGFDLKEEHFKTCAVVLSSISIFRLWRPWNLSQMAETIGWLEEHWKTFGESSEVAERTHAAA